MFLDGSNIIFVENQQRFLSFHPPLSRRVPDRSARTEKVRLIVEIGREVLDFF
jgi:hypothetical protein